MNEHFENTNPWAKKLEQVSIPDFGASWQSMQDSLDKELPLAKSDGWSGWLMLGILLFLLFGVCNCPGNGKTIRLSEKNSLPSSENSANTLQYPIEKKNSKKTNSMSIKGLDKGKELQATHIPINNRLVTAGLPNNNKEKASQTHDKQGSKNQFSMGPIKGREPTELPENNYTLKKKETSLHNVTGITSNPFSAGSKNSKGSKKYYRHSEPSYSINGGKIKASAHKRNRDFPEQEVEQTSRGEIPVVNKGKDAIAISYFTASIPAGPIRIKYLESLQNKFPDVVDPLKKKYGC